MDEYSHIVIFENIIRSLIAEGVEINQSLVQSLFNDAVKEEIEWNTYLFNGFKIGFNENTIDQYVKNLCNKRVQKIGFKPFYLDDRYQVNPFSFLEGRGYVEKQGNEKQNFFEKTVTEYVQSSVYSSDEWDDV